MKCLACFARSSVSTWSWSAIWRVCLPDAIGASKTGTKIGCVWALADADLCQEQTPVWLSFLQGEKPVRRCRNADQRASLLARLGSLLDDNCANAFKNGEVTFQAFATYTQLASIDGSTLRAPEESRTTAPTPSPWHGRRAPRGGKGFGCTSEGRSFRHDGAGVALWARRCRVGAGRR
jgi:hypothetical protein